MLQWTLRGQTTVNSIQSTGQDGLRRLSTVVADAVLRKCWHGLRCFSTTLTKRNKHAMEMLEHLSYSGAMELRHSRSIRIQASVAASCSVPPEHASPSFLSTANIKAPAPDTKIVHFQRHGQGYHNLIYGILNDAGAPVDSVYDLDPLKNPFVRPEIVDSPLTELGREQCRAKREEASRLNPELIVVSPLHRTIQTALITFDNHQGKVPIVAHEACREEMGLLVCNKRRAWAETQQEFPAVDFSEMKKISNGEDDDPFWEPGRREPPQDQSNRIYQFLTDFVRHLPEQEIALVTHSAWLFNMCHTVLDLQPRNGEEEGKEDLGAWFATSEIRSMKLQFFEQ